MIKRIFDWLMQPLGMIAAGIVVLSLFSLAAYGIAETQKPPPQPLEFPHKTHVAFGIQCLYCHPGAATGPAAGLPAPAKCWGCHNQIQKTTDPNSQLAILVEHVQNGEPIEWVPVAMVPDFVQFNHRPHIAAGKNCEECHGDMSKVTIAENPQVFNMGWCINCHKQNSVDDPVKRTKLTDCGTCHY